MRRPNQNNPLGKRAPHQQLWESEHQVRQMIEALPVAIVVSSGADERVESINNRFTELFGYTTEDIPNVASWWPLAYPDETYREEIKARWSAKVERSHGRVEAMEASVICKDGTRRYVEFRLSSIGKKHLITFIDLTERRQVEETLHEREKHSQSLLQLSRNLERAQTYGEVLQAARKEVQGIIGYQNLWVYLLTEDRQHFKALLASGTQEKAVMDNEEVALLPIKGDRMLEEIAAVREIIVVEDARTDERTDKKIVEKLGNRTIVNIPIILLGRHLGTIGTGSFGDEGVRPPTAMDRDYLKALASHVAAALDRLRLFTERKQAGQALHESEEKFRAVIEQSAEGIILVDEQGSVIEWNQSYEKMTGLARKDVIGKPFWDIVSELTAAERKTPQRREYLKSAILEALKTGESPMFTQPMEVEINAQQNREKHYLQQTVFPVKTEAGFCIASLTHDVTEKKLWEEALQNSEEKYRTLYQESFDGLFITSPAGKILDMNRKGVEMFGYDSMEEMQSLNLATDVYARPEDRQRILKLVNSGNSAEYEVEVKRKNSETMITHCSLTAVKDETGTISSYRGIIRDITEKKRAEEDRRAYLRFLKNMDRVNRAIQATNDFQQMMSDVLDILLSIFDCDRAWLAYPCDPDAETWQVPMERTRPEYPGVLPLGIELPMEPAGANIYRILRNTDGPVKFGAGEEYPVPLEMEKGFNVQSIITMAFYPKIGKPWSFGLHQCSRPRIWNQEEERLFREISRRLSDALTSLLAYRDLQESEERYRRLVELSPDAIGIHSQGLVVFTNPANVQLMGAKSEAEILGRPTQDFIHPDSRLLAQKRIHDMLTNNMPVPFVEEKFLRLDGTSVDVEVAAVPFQYQGRQSIQIIARDITERKKYEREQKAILTVSAALRQAVTRAEILNVILDQLMELFKADGVMLVLPNPQTGGFIDEMGRGIVAERMAGLHIPPGQGVCNWVITNKKPYLNNRAESDALFYRPDLLGESHCLASVPLVAQERAIGALWIARKIDLADQDLRLLTAIADIAANAIHRIMLHEQTELQLHHLIALHQIDLAISSNFDSNVTLNVILNNVKNELEMDAAGILLLNPITHTLDYAAGIGFKTRNIEHSHVKIGEGCAGTAALEYRTVSCPDLKLAPGIFSRSSLLADETFTAHYATPLVVKGQIKGVLELFHRNTVDPDPEWINYFETLATQAAIAIESASLLENLQRSNTELKLAYDATIEGWSRALDLRDRETEGHTQRVTKMALELAEKMGMDDTEKQNLWRGSLLHDIGKMGVPDSILLKNSPLTQSEWEIMRMHPTYAHQMLSPISYLKNALEISYCHHEKWDGSGYPRGLKGEEIPLSARLFSVVDVFDALTSDRPYRAAWPQEEVYRYIQEQTGKHFDPQVAKIFLEARGYKPQ